jgi:hypothetical protein
MSGQVGQANGKGIARSWRNSRQRKTSQSGSGGSSQKCGKGDLGATPETLPEKCNCRTRTPLPTRRTSSGTRLVSARCQSESQREDRRIQGAPFSLMRVAPLAASRRLPEHSERPCDAKHDAPPARSKVSNIEQTASTCLCYRSAFLGSKGFLLVTSPHKGNGRDVWRCGVLLSPRALSRTASSLKP